MTEPPNEMSYTDSLAAHAAASIKRRAENQNLARVLAAKSRGALRRMAGPPPAPPHTTFPNSLGSYRGKRKDRPLVAPLAPRERFVRLVAAYLAFASRPRSLSLVA